jgi:hypothetical protein
MRANLAASFVLLLLAAVPAHAQNDGGSVNWLLPGCRSAVRQTSGVEDYRAGICSGIVRGISFASPNVCPPQTSNVGQMLAVVMRYVEQRPDRWHEDFMRVASEVLVTTWPCRR